MSVNLIGGQGNTVAIHILTASNKVCASANLARCAASGRYRESSRRLAVLALTALDVPVWSQIRCVGALL